MKKFAWLLLVFVLVGALLSFQKTSFVSINVPSNATYVVVTKRHSYPEYEGVQVVQNGNTSILTTTYETAKMLHKTLNQVQAQAWEMETSNGKEFVKQLVRNLNVQWFDSYCVGELYVLNGYTNHLNGFVRVGKHKQNLQVAMTQNKVVIGYPLLLHSY